MALDAIVKLWHPYAIWPRLHWNFTTNKDSASGGWVMTMSGARGIIVILRAGRRLTTLSVWSEVQLLRAVHQEPARSIKALAERLKRDYKRVHEDVETLAEPGLLQRNDGRVAATFDVIHADLDLRSAA
jgi:hypothetical protein